MALLKSLLPFSVEATAIAQFFNMGRYVGYPLRTSIQMVCWCWKMVILMGFFQASHHIRHLLLHCIICEHCELVELYAVFERCPVPQAQTFGLCPIDAHPGVFFMLVFDNVVPLSLGFTMNKLAEQVISGICLDLTSQSLVLNDLLDAGGS